MKMNNFGKAVIVLAIIGVIGFAATSFAGWGRGGGNCWGQGAGWAQRGSGPAGSSLEIAKYLCQPPRILVRAVRRLAARSAKNVLARIVRRGSSAIYRLIIAPISMPTRSAIAIV